MRTENLEKINRKKLRDWFWDEYDMECYRIAEKEFDERKKHLSWWKRNTISEEDRQWLIKRTNELLEKRWEEETA